MSADLIHTKLSIPPSRPQLVHRERLYQMLDRSINQKLTLVTAPAGFGKSTLLSSWAERCKTPIAWYSLDERDNTPERFLTYMLSSLDSVAPQLKLTESAAALRQAQDSTTIEALLTFLINEFEHLEKSIGIVLDDYHLIEDEGVHDLLSFMLDHSPPTIHLLLASRQEPPFSYARLRASGQLLELSEEDLSFTHEEASQFLHDIMGLQISASDVAALDERTEGWIAGLQLAALSIEGREDVEGFIADLRGTDRYILDYLAEEVFNHLPELLQSFMLRISIADRFNASLCDALVDDWDATIWDAIDVSRASPSGSRSRPILEFLDSSNLFVVPLDHERVWYRFHHLFAEFLRDQLQARHKEDLPELHQLASKWFSSEGFLSEAIEHALAAGDPGEAASLIERMVKPMLSRGESSELNRWIDALPDEILETNPMVLFGLVWSYMLNDPIRYRSEIEKCLSRISARLEIVPESLLPELSKDAMDPSRRDLLGQYALLLGFLGRDSQPFEVTIALFQASEAAFAPNDFFSRAFAYSGLASTYARQGNLSMAEEAFARAAELGQQSDSPYIFLVAKDWQATTQAQQGQLNLAAENFRFVIDQLALISAERLPLTAHAFVGLADVLLAQNNLEEALDYVNIGIDRGQRTIDRDALLSGYLIQARILNALGQVEAAQEALKNGVREALNAGSGECRAEAEAWQAMLNLSQGDVPAGLRWAEGRGVQDTPTQEDLASLNWSEKMALARLSVVQDEPTRAKTILRNMLKELESSELGLLTMEVRCALSVVLQMLGDRERAQQVLAKALLEGEPEGFVRCFLDEGPRMAALLRTVAASGHSPGYAKRLLKAFGEALSDEAPIEPLTERELDVLRLLSEGLTNAAIAEQLVVAQSTIKTHINHIYAKLGVTQRTQAVARARELHLL